MTTMTVGPILPDLAGNILLSLKRGDLDGLESALDHAEAASTPRSLISTDMAERLELIGAIASAMRADVRHHRTACAEVYVPLLYHLQR